MGGGYTSLAFYDSGSASQRYKPALSYYDAQDTALRFARCTSAWDGWSVSVVASSGSQGQYSNLYFDSGNRANIFFYNRTKVKAQRAVLNGSSWTINSPSTGGQEIRLALRGANVAFTDSDATTDHMYVTIL